MKEESINNVTKAVGNSTNCTTKTDMKLNPIDDVEIGNKLVPRNVSDPVSSDVLCGSDPTPMEVSEVLRPMLCDDCGFKTDEKSIFEDHVRTHAENDPRTPNFLANNPSSKRTSPEQTQMLLVCKFCYFTGREQSDLLEHMKIHVKNEIPEDPVQVRTTSIAANLALSNETLQLIEYRIHDDLSESSQPGETVAGDVEMPFPRDGADPLQLKVSGEYSQVSGPSKTSWSNQGSKVLRFTCDVCGYKTNKKVTFEDHLRTHTGEKPFACDLCNYRSSSKHTLGKHKKIHTRPKPFKCDSCEYRGSTRSDLHRHMNTHAKSYALHNGDFVPSSRLQIGTPVMLPMQTEVKDKPSSEPSDTPPQTVYTIFSYDTNLTNVEPNVSTGSSDAPSSAPELVLLHSAALDGFEETSPRISQPTNDVTLGSRTESSNDPLGNDSIPDRPPNDPLQMELSEELSQDDTSNSIELIHSGSPRFACDFCSYTNNRRHEFEVHLRTHTGETPFACGLCDKKYIAKKTLNRHMKSRHGEQQFGCLLCNYRAAQKSDMDEHVRRHGLTVDNTDGNANEPSKTEFEAQYEPANDRLTSERIDEHRDDSSPSWAYEVINTGNKCFTCDDCGYETHQKLDLESHMLTHSGEKVFSCEFCDKAYTASRTLDRHLRENHGEKLFDCGLCDYRAKKKSDLAEHVQTHIKTEDEIVHSAAIKIKLEFERELNEVSNYSGPSESSQPGNDASQTEYETYDPLNDPLQLNLSEEHSQDSSVSRHSESEAIGNKYYRFTCDVCGYKTSRKYEYTVHMRTHTGEKPYGCSLCDYRSIKKSYVNKHMKTHLKNTNSTGDTQKNSTSSSQVESNDPKLVLMSDSPELNETSGNQSESTITVRSLSVDEHFMCEHCDYKCDDLTAWSQHMFEHTREKIFSCEDCDYQTKDIGRFNLHGKVHAVKVEKTSGSVTTPVSSVTITCEFCDYPFTTKADMSEHIMTCHPEKCPHACDFCDFKAFSVRSLELHKETHAVNVTKRVEASLLSRVTSLHVEKYVCYSCDYKACNVEDVERHISMTHDLSAAAATTSLCVTAEMPLNDSDASITLQPDVEEYVCYACDYKAREISQVEEHILRTHSTDITHEIAEPLASLTSESPGDYLVTAASNVGLEEYVCYACDYKACSFAQVQQHIQVTHNLSNSESNYSSMEATSEASSSVAPL